MAERGEGQKRSPHILEEPNPCGFGIRLVNPEAFIRAVIKHFFSPVPIGLVDWENLIHEARVALFEQDLKLGETIPEHTSGYWWKVAAAVGRLLSEDYGIDNMFSTRRRPFSFHQADKDDPETAAMYLEKQRTEPDPATEVENQEWFEHYLGLAEGVILDTEDAQQGERDLVIFELWVNGYSPKEIAENPEVDWLKNRSSVDKALRRIINRLWEFFDVNPEEHLMQVGDHSSMPDREGTGSSAKKNFQDWYANPENRERHREKSRERMRRKRAAEKETREQGEEQ